MSGFAPNSPPAVGAGTGSDDRNEDGDGREEARESAAAAASSQVDLVKALTTALAGMSSRSGTLEVKEKIVIKPWQTEGKSDEQLFTDFLIFQASVLASLQSDGLTDVLNDREIPVGQTNVPLSVLEREYGLKRVERSMKVWNFLLRSVADLTILRLMIRESFTPSCLEISCEP